ncbi:MULTISPECIES: carboxymuconolactone decarboxylase family protein [Rhodobacterales]|uniref:carboxymuconolactone decarboxylase family protein n=1 Tax=Rhodobacterales TaxID=204455 RepID=UPI003297AF91
MSRSATPLPDALSLLETLEPGAAAKVAANLDGFAPGVAELILGHAFTDIIGRDGIDLRTREMLTVAMLSAMGTAPAQLEFHIGAALNTGVTRDEIVEIVLQVSVYAGVPACINAISAAKNAFQAATAT